MPPSASGASPIDDLGRWHCPLCGAALQSVLEEVPCLHWFVTPGARGYRIDRLAPVLEIFELDAIIAFLSVYAATSAVRAKPPVYQRSVAGDVVTVSISCLRRGWIFEYARTENMDNAVAVFDLSLLHDQILMEKASIVRGKNDRRVTIFPMAKRRRHPEALIVSDRIIR